jgi:hypothetical protein
MKNDAENSTDRPMSGSELAIAILLLIAAIVLAWHALQLFFSDQPFAGTRFIGFALVMLSGCFDPSRFVILFMPFTPRTASIRPARFAPIQYAFAGLGLIIVFVAWALNRNP